MESLSRIFASFLLLVTAAQAFIAPSPQKLQLMPRTVVPQNYHVPLGLPIIKKSMGAASMCLHSTSSGEEAADDSDSAAEAKIEKKIAGRKTRVEVGYKIGASVYAMVTTIGLVKYRSNLLYAAYAASAPFMGASVALHLIGSGSSDCLKTSSCKRLNLALASFGFIGLLAKDLITTAKPLWIFGCVVAMVNSIKGYGYGLKGWDLKMMEGNSAALGDILGGMKSSIAAVLDLPSGVFTRSAGYAALAVTFNAMKLTALYRIADHLFSAGPLNKFLVYQFLFRVKTLMLLTVSALTLKEAVDQKDDRPKGWGATPFGLGASTAVITGVTGAFCITRGSLYLGGWLTFLALFSALDGVKVAIKRSK